MLPSPSIATKPSPQEQGVACIDGADLRSRLARATAHDGSELAVVDVRETQVFSQAHLIFSSNLPLSRLELEAHGALPRRGVPIVLVDEDCGAIAASAAALLRRLGYEDIVLLAGGLARWREDGGAVYAGFNVRSKAFAEYVEHRAGTPSLDFDELSDPAKVPQPHVIVDSRTWDEYHAATVPGAIHVDGADLVRTMRDLAPDPGTMVVVACGGRTRSIVGAQSLIAAGLPNRVASLRNGTGGLRLSGTPLEYGASRKPNAPSPATLAWARGAAARRASTVRLIDATQYLHWTTDAERTLYVLDLRSPSAFVAGHLPGAAAIPGGQLVQHIDVHAVVLGARIVLVDDPDLVSARMTAWWLQQLGGYEVAVMAHDPSRAVTSAPPAYAEHLRDVAGGLPAEAMVDVSGLACELDAYPCEVRVIDVSRSTAFRRRHIPGAKWLMRDQLSALDASLGAGQRVVLSSEDGAMAMLALRDRLGDVTGIDSGTVRALSGGNAAWVAAGLPVESGTPLPAGRYPDAWVGPENRGGDVLADTREYLNWEIALLHQVAKDDDFLALTRLDLTSAGSPS